MAYWSRIRWAALFSLLAHAVFLGGSGLFHSSTAPVRIARAEPIVLNLEAPERQTQKRLVESHVAAREDPDPSSDLISDVDSLAQDRNSVEGDRNQPFVEEVSDFDDLGAQTVDPFAETLENIALVERPSILDPPENTQAEQRTAPDPTIEELEDLEEAFAVVEARVEDDELTDTEDAPSSDNEPDRLEAVIQETPVPPEILAGTTRGRIAGGVKATGLASFEAHRHALGAYMLEVRRRVDRAWRSALMLKYSGSTPAAALLDCAIDPRGKLVFSIVIDPGDSATFALLCKEALKRAGPFPPFPFEVPAIFRSKNLEIRWRFTFM